MSLSVAMNSTVFRETSLNNKYKNILYEPKGSIIDSLFFLSGDNYYIITEEATAQPDIENVLYLSQDKLELHNYHTIISHSLERHINNTISFGLHLPLIIIIDNIKPYKKEDKFLIQNKIKNHTKVFFNEETYKGFCKEDTKCFNLKLGVPTDIFCVTQPIDTRKDICLIENTPINNNIKSAIDKTNKICDIIDINYNTQILSEIFNHYKVCIDLGENYLMNLLCAAACGCKCITSSSYSNVPPVIQTITADNSFIQNIDMLLDSDINIDNNIDYIKQNYDFSNFIEKIHNIISHTSHEVFTL